jgi:hypothetical protein
MPGRPGDGDGQRQIDERGQGRQETAEKATQTRAIDIAMASPAGIMVNGIGAQKVRPAR